MAPELDVGMGMGMGTGMGFAIEAFSFPSPPSPSAAATAINAGAPNNNAYLYGIPSSSTADVMHVDDLLDLSGQPAAFDATPTAAVAANPQPYQQQHLLLPEPPVATDLSSPLPLDLRIPGEEEEAELEWLSRFLEESFSGMPFPSNGMMMNSGLLSNNNSGNTNNMNSTIHYNVQHNNYQAVDPSAAAVSGRPRTKRSRPPVAGRNGPAVSAAWSALPPSPSCSSSSSSDTRPRVGRKDKDATENGGGSVRKCTHCASEKTPQWRTGPLGPKTLCNACGVRFKSGRLVPEYRPAASPTFVLTQHSNSHRKVMELRRQKELLIRHQQAAAFVATGTPAGSAATAAASTRPDMLLRDYEVC